MRRSWPKARAFVVEAGWAPVEAPIGKRGRTMELWRDPIHPERDPLYLHEAESREDWRRWIVRHVMTS